MIEAVVAATGFAGPESISPFGVPDANAANHWQTATASAAKLLLASTSRSSIGCCRARVPRPPNSLSSAPCVNAGSKFFSESESPGNSRSAHLLETHLIRRRAAFEGSVTLSVLGCGISAGSIAKVLTGKWIVFLAKNKSSNQIAEGPQTLRHLGSHRVEPVRRIRRRLRLTGNRMTIRSETE